MSPASSRAWRARFGRGSGPDAARRRPQPSMATVRSGPPPFARPAARRGPRSSRASPAPAATGRRRDRCRHARKRTRSRCDGRLPPTARANLWASPATRRSTTPGRPGGPCASAIGPETAPRADDLDRRETIERSSIDVLAGEHADVRSGPPERRATHSRQARRTAGQPLRDARCRRCSCIGHDSRPSR